MTLTAKCFGALAVGAIAWLAAPASAPAQEMRIALVIGEGGYQTAPTLANPPNDARDIAQSLHSLGFDVTLQVDLDQAQMTQAIADFGKRAEHADIALFYYGGHGLQLFEHNYLVPVDAVLRSPADIGKHTVALDSVIDAMAKSAGRRLVFLDACRENPLKREDAEAAAGLARVGKAADFMIAFSTQPDAVAFDGAGRNSPFAQALLAHLTSAGVDLSNTMIAVTHDVNVATGGEQTPWENFSLTKQVYLAGEGAADASPEAALWRLAAPARDGDLLQVYLQRYPGGPHAGDVRSLLKTAAKPSAKPRDRTAEEEIWRLALSSREPALVELYRTRFPDGAYAHDADELAERLAEVARFGEGPRHIVRSAGDPPERCDGQRPRSRSRDAGRQCGDGDRRLRAGVEGRSRDGALSGVARAREIRLPPFRRGDQTLPRRGCGRRRARPGEPRTARRDGRPYAQGRRRRLRAI